ncbi:MAG: hypothetical protein WDM79_10660 [Terricaulis sp.]
MSILDQDFTFADVVQRLRATTGEDRDFDAAQMQLINLPEVIRSAGPHWPKLKESIRASSVSFLKGCLEEEDIVLPAGDGFLIIFAAGETAELRARAEELRGMLLEFYAADPALKQLGIRIEHRQISSHELGAMIAPTPAPSKESSTHSCLFAPVWAPGAEVIASYFCFPVHREDDGPRYGYDRGFAKEGRFEHRDYCELDIGLLDVAQAALDRYGADDAHPAIGISVHSTTLQHRIARSVYLERLSRVPAHQMKRVYVKIAEIEPGAPLINLADWAGMLRARVRNILLEFHHTERSPPNLVELGVWGAGYLAPTALSSQGADIAPATRQFRRWGESLRRQRLRFFVDNLRRPGLVRLAAEGGAHFITSDNFWPFQKWPGGIVSAPGPSVSPLPPRHKSLRSAPN